ncbi:FAD-dependent 5-carboxymethylaminomethyl-2-thiouridine(34) oxidoreductase MnmC [Caulobacter ginsengisoli]|uniref:FAD-dependent 5-carboxymethylaminomethyl-2-thiouridine(34) oxidoreductase MnmC n=1 Tax=Caulobacter ginsengisoli TaxID=400775 RepID=UPI0027D84738|nr:FAD-dependent 5-carboxymethylaminomethyl-2-thiouridine(34) oxidoreductase MnmC [Caulobacter ginsengisoli]
MHDPSSPVEWTEDGLPRSRLYDDVYFSSQDGLAESRAVFLAGCGLPDAWAGRRRFTVGELGFGSGLNIAALLTLWKQTSAPDARLALFSVEAHPMSAADARRALGRWPEIAEAAQALTDAWPSGARGFHRLELPAFRASLDLAILEVGAALEAWDGAADAWLLDGFAPAANPDMWRQEVLDRVAARSAPGARAATFTVAGAVRRGLTQAGFAVDKQPGFGRKRERLEARLPGEAVIVDAPASVAVIGAGIAGCCLAAALTRRGVRVLLVDEAGIGAGASGNPAALVTPRLDAGLGPVAALFAQAFRHAVDLYDAIPDAVLARGALQLAVGERDPGRFAKIAASDLFAPDELALLDAAAASARLGEPAGPALAMAQARVVEPAVLLPALAGAAEPVQARVERLERTAAGWRLLDAAGGEIALADAVILAAGTDSARLAPDLSLRPVRGQASWAEGAHETPAVAFGGYAIPTRAGLLFGATHDRDREDRDPANEDDSRNLATLAKGLPALAASLAGRPLSSRASIRATTTDHLPLAGAVGDDGLFVLSGLGSRGFCLAPLLAEHLAARLAGAPSPLPRDLARLVEPERFAAGASIQAT